MKRIGAKCARISVLGQKGTQESRYTQLYNPTLHHVTAHYSTLVIQLTNIGLIYNMASLYPSLVAAGRKR